MEWKMTIDTALPALMSHYGISGRRQRDLLVDIEMRDEAAMAMIASAMPLRHPPSMTRGTLLCRLDLGSGSVWSEDGVSIPGVLPETVLEALAGRPLGDIVDHPALRDRRIVSARKFGDDTTFIAVRDGMAPLRDVMGPCRMSRMTGPLRRTLRRHRAAVATRTHFGMPGVWGGACLALMAFVLSLLALMVANAGDDYVMTWNADRGVLAFDIAFAVMALVFGWSMPRTGGETRRNQWIGRAKP